LQSPNPLHNFHLNLRLFLSLSLFRVSDRRRKDDTYGVFSPRLTSSLTDARL
jgi:hypothetical protein